MGLCITAKHSEYKFRMGYGSFFFLRCRIAKALDKEFGKHYSELFACYFKERFKDHDKISDRMIEEKDLDRDIIDFLYQSDCEGKINYRTCLKIHDILEEDGFLHEKHRLRYEVSFHADDSQKFMEFLKECVRYRRNMVWN